MKWDKDRPIRIGAEIEIELGELALFIYLVKAELLFVIPYEHIWYKFWYRFKNMIIVMPFLIVFIAMVLLNIQNESVDAYECIINNESYYVGNKMQCPSTTTITSTTTTIFISTTTTTIKPTTTTIKTFCSNKPNGWYCIDDTKQECINRHMGATKDCYYIGIPNNEYPRIKVRGECRESQGYGKAECYKK